MKINKVSKVMNSMLHCYGTQFMKADGRWGTKRIE